jgi:hypothetical protein
MNPPMMRSVAAARQALEPVHRRVEHIGEHHPGDERP